MITIFPTFFPSFACKADKCRHTCCQKWEIDIDEDTAETYRHTPGPLGDELRAWITTGDEGSACFRLNHQGYCHFLNEKGLCRLILEMGPSSLCQICRDHPRFYKFTYDSQREEDVTLAGPVEASLKVALSTSDADFVVKLIDVYPDEGEKAGMQMLVRGDVVRGRYRDGFARPKAFVPGSPETVPFRTTDIAHTFRAGHRIMVQVQSSWFPLTERNPQQYVDLWRCAASDFVPCRVTLFHQRDRASSLTVYKL